jgi:hypothetical protein
MSLETIQNINYLNSDWRHDTWEGVAEEFAEMSTNLYHAEQEYNKRHSTCECHQRNINGIHNTENTVVSETESRGAGPVLQRPSQTL